MINISFIGLCPSAIHAACAEQIAAEPDNYEPIAAMLLAAMDVEGPNSGLSDLFVQIGARLKAMAAHKADVECEPKPNWMLEEDGEV